MNLPKALEIVKDHIRIGKGMELVNGVPEALEMMVEELAVTQKALELACEQLSGIIYGNKESTKWYINEYLTKAKEGVPHAD